MRGKTGHGLLRGSAWLRTAVCGSPWLRVAQLRCSAGAMDLMHYQLRVVLVSHRVYNTPPILSELERPRAASCPRSFSSHSQGKGETLHSSLVLLVGWFCLLLFVSLDLMSPG